MIIANELNPEAKGMFSKTGKFTSEKFFILRKKDEILNQQDKVKPKNEAPVFKISSKIVC